ncbi:MAG: prepilin-type N-terminal cleavage/methylation domain-containing protein [Luminiphilus sp.]|nr:prepilin-type N-terminal cleavage/methylation domain-containing protein [Luminiphilus sp.]
MKIPQSILHDRSPLIAKGFSLIELLIAVLVIVLLTSVVSLNVGRGDGAVALKEDAKHLVALMNYVQAEAEMSGVDHGLYLEQRSVKGVDKTSGHWLRRYDQGWAEPRGSRELLAPFVFDENTELWLTLAEYPNVEIGERDPDLRPSPQIVFFASGEVTEGQLEWMTRDTGKRLFSVDWSFFGDFNLLAAGETLDADQR